MPATSEEPISAIIPTVGRADALERCLHSILRQTQRVAEVVIVHCGDDAETLAMAASPQWLSAGLEIRYFHHPERNAAKQRNFAVRQAKHDNLLLLDDDVELESKWAVELFKPIWEDAQVGATMGKLVNQPMAQPTFIWKVYRRLLSLGDENAFAPGRLIGAVVPNGFPLDAETPMPTEWIGGGASALRREAFLSVGGFAPYFMGSSPGEDLDLGYRLSRHWKVLYVPSARCVHHRNPSNRETRRDYQIHSMRARYAILLRAFEMRAAVALGHIILWIFLQGLSEMAALRNGLDFEFLYGWWGRLHGVASCLSWDPPETHPVPSLFPRLSVESTTAHSSCPW
jgi:GT2 family glycosyltransferase